MKSLSSTRLSLLWLVSSSFFHRSLWLVFFWFLQWSYIILTPKTWQFSIWRNFTFPSIWPKGPQVAFSTFLGICFHFIFLKTVWKENFCDTWLPISISMSGKDLGLEFSYFILLNDHIAGFLRVLYLKNECRYIK